jgi:hypothetical protein
MLNNRITATREALQDDLALRLSFLEKKLSNPPPTEAEELLRVEVAGLREAVEAAEGRLEGRVQALEEAKAKGDEEMSEIRRAQSHKSIATRVAGLSRSRKRMKSHRNATLYENQDDIDQIVNKISQLENRIQQ